MAVNQIEFFQSFKDDIKRRNPQILPQPDLNQRVTTANNHTLPPEVRNQARTEVLDSVLRLIPIAISRFAPSNIPPEELVGEAYETIEACIRNYDQTASFPYYVFTSLRLKLRSPQTIIDPEQPFHIPSYRRQEGYRIAQSFSPIAQKLQREPNRDEWYMQTAYNPSLRGWEAYENKRNFESIHNLVVRKPYIRIGHEVSSGKIDLDNLGLREGMIEEVLIDESSSFTPGVENNIDQRIDLENAFSELTPRQLQVVMARMESEGSFKTHDEIAKELGVSREDISQIWRAALRNLRRLLRADYSHWTKK